MRLLSACGLLTLSVLALAGCRELDLAGPPAPPTIVRFEVWNRTELPVFFLDEDGRRLDVPACGTAVADAFRMDSVRVGAADGYIFGFGSSHFEPLDPKPQYLVLVARSGESFPQLDPPTGPLPPCRGLPEVQVGE